jgi:hypothetical protein
LLQKNLLPLIEELFAFPSADSKLQALYNLALRAATQKSAAAWSLWMEVVDVWFLHLLRRKSGVSCNLSSLPILQNKPVPEDFLARFSLEQLQEIWEKSRATLGDVSRIYLDPQHAMLACFADFTKK